MKRQNKGKLN